MPEMPDHDLRTTIDALCARLQADLHTQAAQMADRLVEERDAVRRETEEKAAELWTAKVEAVREEWQGRLQAGLADAAADADRRMVAEADRTRLEIEGLNKAAAEAADRHRKEIEAVRDEWQGRLQAGLADAAADADRRVIAETDRIRRENDQASAGTTERIREQVREEVRRDMEQAAEQQAARLKEDMDRALAAERERAGAALEAEWLKTQALTAALEEAQVKVSQERDAARLAAASLLATQNEQKASDAQAVIEARVAERQAHLAVVERLLGAVNAIDDARSLSDTLTSVTHAAATVAPRAALFIVADGVNGQDLQGWQAAGFDKDSPASLRFSGGDRAARGLLDLAVSSGRAVSTAAAQAPSFASLPQHRAGLAVPITVGGRSVAVLYADDAPALEPEAPACWPEAIQVLAAHASACLERITAVRTTQAMQQMSSPGAARPAVTGVAGNEEDSSARRYARLLVSEIKLYNEAAVRTGREKRDLLNRLAPEIERARRLYEERVSPSIGARATYFQQELVHTLADGDSALLGGAA